jgi:hypothetical protein
MSKNSGVHITRRDQLNNTGIRGAFNDRITNLYNHYVESSLDSNHAVQYSRDQYPDVESFVDLYFRNGDQITFHILTEAYDSRIEDSMNDLDRQSVPGDDPSSMVTVPVQPNSHTPP